MRASGCARDRGNGVCPRRSVGIRMWQLMSSSRVEPTDQDWVPFAAPLPAQSRDLFLPVLQHERSLPCASLRSAPVGTTVLARRLSGRRPIGVKPRRILILRRPRSFRLEGWATQQIDEKAVSQRSLPCQPRGEGYFALIETRPCGPLLRVRTPSWLSA